MFHVSDGLYFERLENGSVRIVKRSNANADAPIVFEQTIDEHSWVSIVAEVSFNPQAKISLANEVHRGIGSAV